jgi:hypothetical protein
MASWRQCRAVFPSGRGPFDDRIGETHFAAIVSGDQERHKLLFGFLHQYAKIGTDAMPSQPLERIFVDLDGVLTDFVSAALRLHGQPDALSGWP